MNRRCLVVASFVLGLAALPAHAQQVFLGDPVDPGTGQAYPVLPGLPLVLPGPDEDFGTGDDVLNLSITGDVDLVIRSGSFAGPAIPAPALAIGGAAIATVTAGGGSTGQGAEAGFSVAVSDGSGTYGNVITAGDLDLRPVTVYAFADLDDDGVLGPTDADGTADNNFELQEVTAYGGRQMGTLFEGRFDDSLGIEIGAPASLGGVVTGLVAGAYTGSTPEDLFTDGPLMLTRWPFFPPLDPKDLLGGGDAPSPDPTLANELEWDIELNWIPPSSHPSLGGAFAVEVDGSEPTTDQLLVESGPAITARIFAEPAAASFLARARPRLRVAPEAGGPGRSLVLPIERAVLTADGAATQLSLRLLPVDLFANVADPAAPITVALAMSGSARIVSPDADSDDRTETVALADASGEEIVIDDDGSGVATLTLSIDGNPVATVALAIGPGADSDGDGVADDGNASDLAGDRPCDAATSACDDNCPRVINPSQIDSNHDGLGDCCDGTCIDDPLSLACDECALPTDPTSAAFRRVRASVRLGDGSDDKITLKADFTLPLEAAIAPDVETLTAVLTQPGSGGFVATLAGLMVDRMRALPSYVYSDRSGAVGGVTKAQLKKRGDGVWRLLLRAAAPDTVDLAAGGAELSLAIGEDLVGGFLDCSGSAPRLRCELVP